MNTFSKKTLKDIPAKDLYQKKVLLRVAYDISLKQRNRAYVLSDDARIRATLPTIKYLLKHKCSIVFMSWLKRPGGKTIDKYRLLPVSKKLSQILGIPVRQMNDCIGSEVFRTIRNLKPGECIMLENTRFHKEEQFENSNFSKKLVRGVDLIVFDAFGQSHRIHSSTTGILKIKPAVAGFLLEKEISTLHRFISKPKKPFILVLGGAKIRDKVEIIEHLMSACSLILTGGGLANTLLRAQGVKTEASLIDSSYVNQAKGKSRDTLSVAKKLLALGLKKKLIYAKGESYPKLLLPVDLVAANSTNGKIATKIINIRSGQTIPDNWQFLDLGPKTIRLYKKILKRACSVVWNGPLGLFEIKKFSHGTEKIARLLAGSKAKTIICGGDTEKIIKMYKMQKAFYYVSTGGGASLEYLAGKKLPAVELLPKK